MILAAMILASTLPADMAWAEEQYAMSEQIESIAVNDIRIAYREFGPEEMVKVPEVPLLMIMGYGGLMDMWPPAAIVPLARERRVIVFDNRGMGFSTSSDREYSIELFAEDTAKLLDALGIVKAHVLGWSMGTFIAQELALRNPERVGRLILLAGSCGGAEAIWPGDEVWRSMTDFSGTLEERVQRMFSNLFPGSWLAENTDPSKYFPLITAPVVDENLMRQAETLKRWGGSRSRLSKFTAATLIVTGMQDSVILPANADLMAEAIPKATVVRFQDGGHGFFFQYPEATADQVNSFLKESQKR